MPMEKIKNMLAKFSPFLQSAMVVLIASLFVISIVYAATTIGSNISTGGNLEVVGNASTTGYLVVGTSLGSWVPTAGDLFVSGNATTTGNFFVQGGTVDNSTGSPTSTPGIFVRDNATATSTLSVGKTGDGNDPVVGCLEMVGNADQSNEYYRCFINAGKNGIICEAGRCNGN